jgi:replicative DNA helicase
LLRALIGVGRDLVESALDTSEEVAPLEQIEQAETELYKVAEEGGADGKAQVVRRRDQGRDLKTAEKALNSGGHLSGSPPAWKG